MATDRFSKTDNAANPARAGSSNIVQKENYGRIQLSFGFIDNVVSSEITGRATGSEMSRHK